MAYIEKDCHRSMTASKRLGMYLPSTNLVKQAKSDKRVQGSLIFHASQAKTGIDMVNLIVTI